MNLDLARALCQRFEGFRARPYLCPAGVPTIGYGTTRYASGQPVTLEDPPIDEVGALRELLHELSRVVSPAVRRLCPGLLPAAILDDDWRRFCAVVDFAYNLGAGRLQTSTLRRKINEQDWQGAIVELQKWVRGGGRILPGLVARRKAEAALLGE